MTGDGAFACRESFERRNAGFGGCGGRGRRQSYPKNGSEGRTVHLLFRLDRYTGKAPFGPWLVRVAKNYRASCARREQREDARTADFDEALGLAADAGGLDDQAQRRFLEKSVSEALARLPDDEREAVALTILQEKTQAEAAHVIGVRPPTVGNLVRRALFRLQGEERLHRLHEEL